MSISTKLISELRERTGAPLLACKKALIETQGNIEAAILAMRNAGQIQAEKKADRLATEGCIETAVNEQGTYGVLLEVNCQTDFVGKGDFVKTFANQLAKLALENKIQEVSVLSALLFQDGQTVEQARQALVAKTGENIQIRRLYTMETTHQLGCYLHMGKKACLLEIQNSTPALSRDIAMHIVAYNPLVVDRSEVNSDLIEKEREIIVNQLKESGKPQQVVDNIVKGRLNKYLSEVSLLDQPFLKNPNKTVAQYLAQTQSRVLKFTYFVLGEGLEKKVVDFASEVMEQIKG